jgi:hypothetical protein
MRKLAAIGAALAVLGGTTAVMSIASASAAPTSAVSRSVKVLHLISHQTSLQVIDIGKKGPSPGDQIIETTVDFQNGMRVDRSVLNCVDITVTAAGFDVLCHGSLVFSDGQVEFQGETNFQTPFTVAVTGGSGAYQHVGGQLTVVRTLPHSTTDVETLRLVFFESE